MYPQPTAVDLDDAELRDPGLVDASELTVCVSRSGSPASDPSRWLDRSLFALTERDTDDPRFVRVPSVTEALGRCFDRIRTRPSTTRVLRDVLDSYVRHHDVSAGLVAESLAYSTLQAGPEFAQWLDGQGPRRKHADGPGVVLERTADTLSITFDRPERHNAFSDLLRADFLAGLAVAESDSTIDEVRLSGNGPSFCSGGDLREFGLFVDPVSSHLARVAHSPAAVLARLASRHGPALSARVHGAVLGSGLEMAAYCPSVIADRDSIFGLPELELGLVPGAGGTVSVTERIGRWRTAYLVISGERIDAPTALRWGLIDGIA